MPRVKHVRERREANDVYIARPSKWGNPFPMGHRSRADVIALHEGWLLRNEELLADLHELKGKNLVCFCAPQQCHGDILLKLANEEN